MLGKLARLLLVLGVTAAMLIVAARLLFPLPALQGRSVSQAVPASAETRLGSAILPLVEANDGLSGILPLHNGLDAFTARMILASTAEQSLDVQYYIWQRDLTGLILLDALRDAAERGVRVRLLVDDNGVPGLDPELAALNALDTMEVRLFNPFTLRNPRMLSYAFDFPRLNRRMHNKSFTADGIATIIGGRNIGYIYFSHGPDVQYFDLDVLAFGQAATDVSTDFDRYWASASAYPIDLLVETPSDGTASLDAAVAEVAATAEAQAYRDATASAPLLAGIREQTLAPEWVEMTLFSDDPAKGLGLASNENLLVADLGPVFRDAETSIDLISAYFIPGPQFTGFLTDQATAGVRTRVLTNSLQATDVASVHSGWVKYRETLLDAGVEVYELRSLAPEEETNLFGILGSATSSLHAKSFAIDEEQIFIGSFNFDPRSAQLNCEMGFLINSPRLVQGMARAFATQIPITAYALHHDDAGALVWQQDAGQIVHTTEPGSSVASRIYMSVLGALPIEWML